MTTKNEMPTKRHSAADAGGAGDAGRHHRRRAGGVDGRGPAMMRRRWDLVIAAC